MLHVLIKHDESRYTDSNQQHHLGRRRWLREFTLYQPNLGRKLIDLQAVTITLRKGNPDNLDTVGVLADSVEGYSYNWTVSRTLAPAE
jgi:hypothetical protein